MMRKIVEIALLVVFGGCTYAPSQVSEKSSSIVSEREEQSRSEDSSFVYKYFLNYDPSTGEYEDLDEPTVYDYWHEKNNDAVRYFQRAVEIRDIPAYQRMIFANYLLEKDMRHYVTDILKTLNTKSDSARVFHTMSSYGMSFKEFGISEETIKKYSPAVKYE